MAVPSSTSNVVEPSDNVCAILETGAAALGVGGCSPCAWTDAAANNWRDRKDIAAPNTLDLMVRSPAAGNNEREAVSPGVRPMRTSSCLRASFPTPAGWPSQYR